MPRKRKAKTPKAQKQKQKQRQSVVVNINQQRRTVARPKAVRAPQAPPPSSISFNPMIQFPQYDNTSSIISAIKSLNRSQPEIIRDVARVDRAVEQDTPLRERVLAAAEARRTPQVSGLAVQEINQVLPVEELPENIPIYIVKAPTERLNIQASRFRTASTQTQPPPVELQTAVLEGFIPVRPPSAKPYQGGSRRARSLKRAELAAAGAPGYSESEELLFSEPSPLFLGQRIEPPSTIRARVLSRKKEEPLEPSRIRSRVERSRVFEQTGALQPIGSALGVSPYVGSTALRSELRQKIIEYNAGVSGKANKIRLTEVVDGKRRNKPPSQLVEEIQEKELFYLLPGSTSTTL